LTAFLLALLALPMLVALLPTAYAQQAPKGPWVDEVDFFVEADEAKVLDMLLKNEMQAYFRDIRDPGITSLARSILYKLCFAT
jgi:peptide/nickel transport system substrate-binding protein